MREFRSDVGCIEGSANAEELLIRPFMEDELILVAASGHPLAQIPHQLKAVHFQSAPWLLAEKGSGTREYTNYLLQSIGNTKPSKTVISSNEGVKRAVLCELGIAAVSIHTVKEELQSGTLVQLKGDIPSQKRNFSGLYILPLDGGKKDMSQFSWRNSRSHERNV